MRMLLKVLSVICILTLVNSVAADVYRWKDDKGVTHFGDKPPKQKSQTKTAKPVTTVSLHDTRLFSLVKSKTPIRYQGKTKAALVLFKELSIKRPSSGQASLVIGKQMDSSRGICTDPKPITWSQGALDMTESSLMSDIIVAFNGENYRMITGKFLRLAQGSRLSLSVAVLKLRLDVCNSYGNSHSQKAAAYVKLSWRLVDLKSNKQLHAVTTEGAVNNFKRFTRNGAQQAVQQALSMATRNLLAEPAFVDHMAPLPGQNVPEKAFDRLDLTLSYGNAGSDFDSEIENLKNTAVTIRTSSGHGSGVFLDKAGHILTNAHVVDGEDTVTIIQGRTSMRATVLRRELYRDVALLKVKDFNQQNSAVISKANLSQGDKLYVIGTPLDESLNNKVTKGVLSSLQTKDGLTYYLTDAAISPGNSGGPVFDARGELIGISVSSVFTGSRTNLKGNYLIPINDAIEKLNIGQATNMDYLLDAIRNNNPDTETAKDAGQLQN